MKSIAQFPRLTRRDVERLLDVHQQLNRARQLLERTTSPVAHATSALIMSALVLVSELYNRSEVAFLRGEVPAPEPSLELGQFELPAAPAEVTTVDVEPDYNPKG